MADGETLKQKNLPWLGAFLVLSGLALSWFVMATPNGIDAWKGISSITLTKAVLAFWAPLVVVPMNIFAGPGLKAMLVFWRRQWALPGHRFLRLSEGDSRIDLQQLKRRLGGSLPTSPKAQNDVWLKMYRAHEGNPSVRANHQEFLLLRDLTWLSVCIGVIGTVILGVHWHGGRLVWLYLVVHAGLYLVFSTGARLAGNRFTLTVVACESNQSDGNTPRVFSNSSEEP